ncbi:MAG: hypothetical protein V4706_04650 [Pseudomonadota bacterium]
MFLIPARFLHPVKSLRVLASLILLAWCVLFIGGLVGHQGSRWVYVVFSVVLTAVLLSGLYRPKSYGYLFLAIFFWLGFWLKLSVHNIFQYDYVEPVGRFDSSPAAWDEALWVATVAGMGLLVGRWLYGAWRGKHHLVLTADSARVPLWYPAHRRMVWMLLMGSIAVLAALNSIYGIQQSGLTPRTILVWPLNGLIYWLLSTGFSMALATILWWDICLKKDISLPVYAVFVEAFLSTMSLLSRGIFLFHIIPQLLAIELNRQQAVWRSRLKFLRVIGILAIFFVISLAVVSTLRSYLFQSDQDFRTMTQNKITRLQILQTVVPTFEERLLIMGISRRDVLAALVPIVEEMVQSTDMPDYVIERKMKIHKLSRVVPLKDQLGALRFEQQWLHENIPAMQVRADAARRLYRIDHQVEPKETILEDQFQPLAIEKDTLEQQLKARQAEMLQWRNSPSGKARLLLDEIAYQLTTGLITRVAALAVDRWIGMEGVMAISAYPGKSVELFETALTERAGLGEAPLYQRVCQSIYQTLDLTKYQFASLPGASAFFYYSGSLLFVFAGMLGLTLGALWSEHLVSYLTGNAILCALVGMNAANAIAQLGVVPRQLLIHLGMLFLGVLIIGLLQSRVWEKIRRRTDR